MKEEAFHFCCEGLTMDSFKPALCLPFYLHSHAFTGFFFFFFAFTEEGKRG